RLGARDLPRRNRAAGAAAILDDDLLAEHLAHAVGGAARHGVVAAAGGVGNDQRDGAGWGGLLGEGWGGGGQRCGCHKLRPHPEEPAKRASRRMASGTASPAAILRDAFLRNAPQDEAENCGGSHHQHAHQFVFAPEAFTIFAHCTSSLSTSRAYS